MKLIVVQQNTWVLKCWVANRIVMESTITVWGPCFTKWSLVFLPFIRLINKKCLQMHFLKTLNTPVNLYRQNLSICSNLCFIKTHPRELQRDKVEESKIILGAQTLTGKKYTKGSGNHRTFQAEWRVILIQNMFEKRLFWLLQGKFTTRKVIARTEGEVWLDNVPPI